MARQMTLRISKVVSGADKPDTGRTVTIVRQDGGATVATATETPAGSGLYSASFAEVNAWGYWSIDGVTYPGVSQNSPFWLGSFSHVSGSGMNISGDAALTGSLYATGSVNISGSIVDVKGGRFIVTSSTAYGQIAIRSLADGAEASLSFRDLTDVPTDAWIIGKNVTVNEDRLDFWHKSNVRMTLGTGSLGVNKAGATPNKNLDVNGSGLFTGSVTSTVGFSGNLSGSASYALAAPASPAGLTGQFQYNGSGSLSGSAALRVVGTKIVGSGTVENSGSLIANGVDLGYLNSVIGDPTGYVHVVGGKPFPSASLRFSGAKLYLDCSQSLDYYIKGKKYTLASGSPNVDIDLTEGLHWIAATTAGGLEEIDGTQDLATILTETALTAVVYYDAKNSKHILLADERHGLSMPWSTHYYHHVTEGAKYINGLALTSVTSSGNGASDTHAQFGHTSGTITDEDLRHYILEDTAPGAYSIYYLSGSTALWREKVANNFPLITSGTTLDFSGSLPAYNRLSGGVWDLYPVGTGKFLLMHVYGSNDPNRGVVIVCGQTQYDTATAARQGAITEIGSIFTEGLPFVEFVPIATVIFQVSSGYGNTVKARVIATDTGADYIDWRSQELRPGAGTSPTDHGSLSGLSDDDHPQYLALSSSATARGDQTIGFGSNIHLSGSRLDITSSTSYGQLSIRSLTAGAEASIAFTQGDDLVTGSWIIGRNITANQNRFDFWSGSAVRMTLGTGLGIAKAGAAPNATLDVNGNGLFTGSVTSTVGFSGNLSGSASYALSAPAGPAGLTTQVQFNDGGVMAGDTAFVWDKTNNILTVDGPIRIWTGSMIIGIPVGGLTSTTVKLLVSESATAGTIVNFDQAASNQNCVNIKANTTNATPILRCSGSTIGVFIVEGGGTIRCSGSGAGFGFYDRNQGMAWQLYGFDGMARLFNGTTDTFLTVTASTGHLVNTRFTGSMTHTGTFALAGVCAGGGLGAGGATFTVKGSSGATGRNNVGWLQFTSGSTVVYVPYWTAITG